MSYVYMSVCDQFSSKHFFPFQVWCISQKLPECAKNKNAFYPGVGVELIIERGGAQNGFGALLG